MFGRKCKNCESLEASLAELRKKKTIADNLEVAQLRRLLDMKTKELVSKQVMIARLEETNQSLLRKIEAASSDNHAVLGQSDHALLEKQTQIITEKVPLKDERTRKGSAVSTKKTKITEAEVLKTSKSFLKNYFVPLMACYQEEKKRVPSVTVKTFAPTLSQFIKDADSAYEFLSDNAKFHKFLIAHLKEAAIRQKKDAAIDAQYQAQLKKLRAALDDHAVVVFSNATRAIKYDDYGGIKSDKRRDVFDDFLKSKKISVYDWEVRALLYKFFLTWMKAYKQSISQKPDLGLSEVGSSGLDFELWTARALAAAGWKCATTEASGDQGVDIVAEKNGLRVAVQCKKYKGSVGNKAVQEVSAGMKHRLLDRAVVISTGTYTRSARELAASTGVLLLSERDVPLLEGLLAAKQV